MYYPLFQELITIIPNAPAERMHKSKPIINATTPSALNCASRVIKDILPPGTQNHFTKNMVPRLRDHAGTLKISWDNGIDQDVLATIQCFWDEEFPEHPFTFALGDLIVNLVSLSLCN